MSSSESELIAALIREMREDSQSLKTELREDRQSFKTEMREGFAVFAAEMHKDREFFKAEMRGGFEFFKGEMREDREFFKAEMREGFESFKGEMREGLLQVSNRLDRSNELLLETRTEISSKLTGISNFLLQSEDSHKLSSKRIDALEDRVDKLENENKKKRQP